MQAYFCTSESSVWQHVFVHSSIVSLNGASYDNVAVALLFVSCRQANKLSRFDGMTLS